MSYPEVIGAWSRRVIPVYVGQRTIQSETIIRILESVLDAFFLEGLVRQSIYCTREKCRYIGASAHVSSGYSSPSIPQ